MKALFQGIWNKFAPAGTKPALYTATGGQFYKGKAPIGSQMPYAVYSLVVGTTKYYFDGRDERIRIQIDLYALTNSAAVDLFEYCKTLFDDCQLSVTGYSFGKFERAGEQNPTFADHERWIVDYDVWLHAQT